MQDLGPITDRGNAAKCGPKEAIKRAGVLAPPPTIPESPGLDCRLYFRSPREPDVQPLGKVPHLPDFTNL